MAAAADMTGAQALLATLVDAGVDVCFTNPGTSEMHFVQALDSVPAMRGVLALFEGVATGAADGYARMAGRPAAVVASSCSAAWPSRHPGSWPRGQHKGSAPPSLRRRPWPSSR